MRDYTKTNNTSVTDNKVIIGGLTYMLTDDECDKVKSVLDGIISTRNSTSTPTTSTTAAPKKAYAKPEGNTVYTDDFTTVTEVEGVYRLYISVPLKGDKGDKVRYAIKANAKKEYGATYAGNFDEGVNFWQFPNKTKAAAFIKARKEYNKEHKSK